MTIKKILLFALLAAIVAGCSKTREQQICREWNVYKVDFETIDKDTTGQDQLQNGMEDIFKNIMSDMLSNTHYNFAKDGTYKVSYKDHITEGRWKLEDQGKQLIMHNTGKDEKKEQPKPALIEQLDDTSMVLLLMADQSTYHVRLRMNAVTKP